jgi:hypothetical protein
MRSSKIVIGLSLALCALPAAAVSVKTTMANAEVVIPDVPPMQAIEAVQDALSGWIGSAPMSLKPLPDPLPARPGKPATARSSLGGTPVEILDCSTAVAEVRRETTGARQQMAYNGDLFQACIYPFAKGTKVWLRAVNIDAAESSITHGLFSGIAKAIRGTPGEWLTRRLNDLIEAMKKKLPAVLIERIEAPGLPVQTPDREAVAALLPPEPVQEAALASPIAPATIAIPQSVPVTSVKPDKTALMIEARKNLTAMGLTYHSQAQFLDAVRRKDALAVKLFLDGGGIDPGAKGPDSKSAVELAREAGAAEIVALLETPVTSQVSAASESAPRLPPGAIPAGMFTQPQLTPEQQAQLRQQFIEAVRRQQAQQVQ